MPNYKGVIFDLDGTLIDSMHIWKKIDHEFLIKRGINVPDDYMEAIGHLSAYDTALYTIDRFNLTDTPQKLIEEWIDMALAEYSETKLKPGATEYIDYLHSKDIKIAIATATEPQIVKAALANKSIKDKINIIVTISEVSRGKGFPDIYIKCAEKMNLIPKDCIVFEDILMGIKGAKSGGFYTVAMHDEINKSTRNKIKSICDKYIYDFTEMIE